MSPAAEPRPPWLLTVGADGIGRAETREAAMALLDPKRGEGLAFVIHEASGERWLYDGKRQTWRQFARQTVGLRPPWRADTDG